MAVVLPCSSSVSTESELSIEDEMCLEVPLQGD